MEENKNNNENNNDKKKEPKRDFLIFDGIKAESIREALLGIVEANKYDDERGLEINEREPIKIRIESGGGYIYDGMALVNAMTSSKTPIHTYSFGKAFSMGLIIFLAGHVRFAHKRSAFMQHQSSGQTGGTFQDMSEDIDVKRKLNDMLDDFIVERSSITKSKLLHNRERKLDWFFDGKEAVHYGVAHHLVSDMGA